MDSVEGDLRSVESGDSGSNTPSGGTPQRRQRESRQNAHTHSHRRVLKCVLRRDTKRNSSGSSTHKEKDAHTSEVYPVDEEATNCTPSGMNQKERTVRTNSKKHNKQAKKTIDVVTHSTEPQHVQNYVIDDKEHVSWCIQETGKLKNKQKRRKGKSRPPASEVDAQRDEHVEGTHAFCPINGDDEKDADESEDYQDSDGEDGDDNRHGRSHLDRCHRPRRVDPTEERRRELSIYKKKVNQVNKILYNLNCFNKFSSLEFRKGMSQNKKQKEAEVVETTFTSVTPFSRGSQKENPTSLVTYTLHPKQMSLHDEENACSKNNQPSAMRQAVHNFPKGKDTTVLGRTLPTLHAAHHPYDERNGEDSEPPNQVTVNSNCEGSATPTTHSRGHSQLAKIKQKSEVDSEAANGGEDEAQANFSTSCYVQVNQEEESQTNGNKYSTTLTNGECMQSRKERNTQQLVPPESIFPPNVTNSSDRPMDDTKTNALPSVSGEAETTILLPLPSVNTTDSKSKNPSHKRNPSRKKENISLDGKDDIVVSAPGTSMSSKAHAGSHQTNKRKPKGEEKHSHLSKCQEVGNLDSQSAPIYEVTKEEKLFESTKFDNVTLRSMPNESSQPRVSIDDASSESSTSSASPSQINYKHISKKNAKRLTYQGKETIVAQPEGEPTSTPLIIASQKKRDHNGTVFKSTNDSIGTVEFGTVADANMQVGTNEGREAEQNNGNKRGTNKKRRKNKRSIASNVEDTTRRENLSNLPSDQPEPSQLSRDETNQSCNPKNTPDDHTREPTSYERALPNAHAISPTSDVNKSEEIMNTKGKKKKKKRKKKKKKNSTEEVDTNEGLKYTDQLTNSAEHNEIGQSPEEETPYLLEKESSPMGGGPPQVEYNLDKKCNPKKGSKKGSKKIVTRKGSKGEEEGAMDSASTPQARAFNESFEKVDRNHSGSTPFGSNQLSMNEPHAPVLPPKKGTHNEKQRKKDHTHPQQIDINDSAPMNPIVYTSMGNYANRTMNPLPLNHGFCTAQNLSNVDRTKQYRCTSEDNFNEHDVLAQEEQSNVIGGDASFVNAPPRDGRSVHGGDNRSSERGDSPDRYNHNSQNEEDYSADVLSDNVSSFVSRDYANYVNYINYMNYLNRMNPISHANRLGRVNRALPQRIRRKGFLSRHLKWKYPSGSTTSYMEDLWRGENEGGVFNREPYFNHFKRGYANYMISGRGLAGMSGMSWLGGAQNFGNPNRISHMNNFINGQGSFFPGRQNEGRRNKPRRLLQQPCRPPNGNNPLPYGRQYRVKTFPSGGTDWNNYTDISSTIAAMNNEDVASVEASLITAADEVGGYAPSMHDNRRRITSSVPHRYDIGYNICTSVPSANKPCNKIGPSHNEYHYANTNGGQWEDAKGIHRPVKHDPFLCRDVSYLGGGYNLGVKTPWDVPPYNNHLVVPFNRMGIPPIGTIERGSHHSNNWSSHLGAKHVNVENNFPMGSNYPPGNKRMVVNAQGVNLPPVHPDRTPFHQTIQLNREKMTFLPTHKWDIYNKLRIRKKKKKKIFNDEQYTQQSIYHADRNTYFPNDINKFNAMYPLEYNPLVNTFAGSYGNPSSGFYHLPYGVIPPVGIPLRDFHSINGAPHFANLTNGGNFSNGDSLDENYGPSQHGTYQQGGNPHARYPYKGLPPDQPHMSQNGKPYPMIYPGETEKANKLDKNDPPKVGKKNSFTLLNGNRVEKDEICRRQSANDDQMENENKKNATYPNDQFVDVTAEWKKVPTGDDSRVLPIKGEDLSNSYEGVHNGGAAPVRLQKEKKKKKEKSAFSKTKQQNGDKTNNYNEMVRKYNELKKCSHENVSMDRNDEQDYTVEDATTMGAPFCLFTKIKQRSTKQPTKGEAVTMQGIENEKEEPHECLNYDVEGSYAYVPQNGQHLNDKKKKRKKKKKKKRQKNGEEVTHTTEKAHSGAPDHSNDAAQRGRNQSCVTLSHYDKFIASRNHLPLRNGRIRSLSLNLDDKPRIHLLPLLHGAIQRYKAIKVDPPPAVGIIPPTTLHRGDSANNAPRNALQADLFLLLRKTEELLIDLLKKVKPSKDIKRTKRKIFSLLSKLIKHLFTCDIKIYTVGSSAYGVDSKTSDLDIVIQANLYNPKYILRNIYNYIEQMKRNRERENDVATKQNEEEGKDNPAIDAGSKVQTDQYHLNIHEKLRRTGVTPLDPSECAFFDNVQLQLVDSARVPILTLRKNDIVCDVSVNTNNSLKHTEFFSSILKRFPNLKNVMRILKLLLKVRTLPSMKQGGLPTILWMMLSVCYCKLPMGGSSFCGSAEKYPFGRRDQGKTQRDGKQMETSTCTSAISPVSSVTNETGVLLPCVPHTSGDPSLEGHTDQLKGRDSSDELVCSLDGEKDELLNGGYYHDGGKNAMMEKQSIDCTPGSDEEDTKKKRYITGQKETARESPAHVQHEKGLNDGTTSPGWSTQMGELRGSSPYHHEGRCRKGKNSPQSNNPHKSHHYNRSSEGHLHTDQNQPMCGINDGERKDALPSGELKFKEEKMHIGVLSSSPSVCSSLVNSAFCGEPMEKDEKEEENKNKRVGKDETREEDQTASHFSSMSCHLVEEIFSHNEYEESSANSCCHHYAESCRHNCGSDGERGSECVSTFSMNCFDSSLTQSTKGQNQPTQQQKRKRNVLKIMHRNGKILSQFEPPMGITPNEEGKNEGPAKCVMNSQNGGRRDQPGESHHAISENHLMALAPLFYSLMILFNELNSRKKLTRTINIIDEEKCHLKNPDEINKRLLSSVCHGGVWDELLTLYDPIYSFNYERYISRTGGHAIAATPVHVGKPKEKTQTSPTKSTTGSHMYRENFRKDPHQINDIMCSMWSKKKAKSLTPDECRKSGSSSPAISSCSPREVHQINRKDQAKEETNAEHHLEKKNKITTESFLSMLTDVTSFRKMDVRKHSGKRESVSNGVVHSASVDRVNCGGHPYWEHPPWKDVKGPFVGDTVKTCGVTPPPKEIKMNGRITSGSSISTNSSSSGNSLQISHAREGDFLKSGKRTPHPDGKTNHTINEDIENEVDLAEEEDKTNPFLLHNAPQLDSHCDDAGGISPTRNSHEVVEQANQIFSPHPNCNTEMVKTFGGEYISNAFKGALRKGDRPSISENPPTRRREHYMNDEDVTTTTMDAVRLNGGRGSHFFTSSSNIAWGSLPHLDMRNTAVTSGSYFNDVHLSNSLTPSDTILHGMTDANFRIHDGALHMCSNEVNTSMSQHRCSVTSNKENTIRLKYNQNKHLTDNILEKNNKTGNRVEVRTTARNIIQTKRNIRTFEKKYEQNIDLAGKVSSATWLIYLYELKRASFFINYYLHHLHLFICFKKHFNGGGGRESNGIHVNHIPKHPCDAQTRITKNYEIFQKKQWLTIKINSRDELSNADKPSLQRREVLFPNATFPLLSQTEQPIILDKGSQLDLFKRESPQVGKKIHSDERVQTEENTTLSERIEKNNLDPTGQIILKCILENLKCCIHALFERTKGEIYVLPFRPQLGSSHLRRSSKEEIPSKGNHPNDGEREQRGGRFAIPTGESTEDSCNRNAKSNNHKEQSLDDPTDAENQYALVLIEGKLVFVKFVKICIDRNKFWDENFLCRRDIRTVIHAKALDVLFISNKAIKTDKKKKKKKKKNQDGRQIHPNSDTNGNENLAKQICTSSDTSDIDQMLLEDNSLDENERFSKRDPTLSDFPCAASEKVQNDAAAPGGGIKGEKPASKEPKGRTNDPSDGKNPYLVDNSKRTMKSWDYEKQKLKAKCSNFIYNSRNDYLGLLVEQNGGGRDRMVRRQASQPSQTGEPCAPLKPGDVFLINPCNFVTRVNVKTVYVPRRSLKDELADTICERAHLKESQMRNIFMLREMGQSLSGSTVPFEEAQQGDCQTDEQKEKQPEDDDVCCVRIIPRSEIMRYKELIRITRNSPFYHKKAKHISNNANPPLQQPVSVCNFCQTRGTFNVKTNHFTLSHVDTDVGQSITQLLRQLIHGKYVSAHRRGEDCHQCAQNLPTPN
ncbi:Erythrocyte membrane-associated protein [Plasmodium coatneyi]|uniref:Erythrocyte membrane-associated protein n=1 Tax=Plasmodium coatneyi TaxID=208452 RepID=A0A1B1DVC0_9APIC|nr:Erythrocyte membrane-associated protein [Plasmodium coatneyi]ANQ06746.1 Erythrocyte membrane-associated protein [Plasmodium coatneyi]